MRKKEKRLVPIHPGEILRNEFLVPLGLSMNKLSMDLRVPVTRKAAYDPEVAEDELSESIEREVRPAWLAAGKL